MSLVDEEPPDPDEVLLGRLRAIDKAHRQASLRERLASRRRFNLVDTWAIAEIPLPRRMRAIPWATTTTLVTRILRTAVYLVVGAPSNRVAKSRRLGRISNRRREHRELR